VASIKIQSKRFVTLLLLQGADFRLVIALKCFFADKEKLFLNLANAIFMELELKKICVKQRDWRNLLLQTEFVMQNRLPR
jgi:hypothetical protein